MIIEVIARQIGEGAGGNGYAVEPMLVEAVRRSLTLASVKSPRRRDTSWRARLWGGLVSCGRLSNRPTAALARDSGGSQPPRRLPARPTLRPRAYASCAYSPQLFKRDVSSRIGQRRRHRGSLFLRPRLVVQRRGQDSQLHRHHQGMQLVAVDIGHNASSSILPLASPYG